MTVIGSNLSNSSRLIALRAEVLSRNAALQPTAPPQTGVRGFGDALAQVSAMQEQAGDLSVAFDRGDMTDIARVMVARQKASVAFEATLQVRNKLLGAYRDIMNMSV